MLLAIYWMTSFIYFKTMPVLLYDTGATLSFAAICATISSFCAAVFIMKSNQQHFKWAAVEENRGPLPMEPLGYLIIFCAVTILASYFVSIGFSSKLHRKVFYYGYDHIDAYLFAFMIASPAIVLYGILVRDAFNIRRIMDGDSS